MPANPGEGHDPFFPDSTRPYSVANAASQEVVTTLTIKGITHEGDSYFAIIGNHTYGVGDEGMEGSVHVRCIEIKPDSVTVELNGQRHELTLPDNP